MKNSGNPRVFAIFLNLIEKLSYDPIFGPPGVLSTHPHPWPAAPPHNLTPPIGPPCENRKGMTSGKKCNARSMPILYIKEKIYPIYFFYL